MELFINLTEMDHSDIENLKNTPNTCLWTFKCFFFAKSLDLPVRLTREHKKFRKTVKLKLYTWLKGLCE